MHPADQMKDCPSCAEPIRARAVRCRFCGHEMPDGASKPVPHWETMPAEQRMPDLATLGRERPTAPLPPRNSFQICMGCVGYVVAGFVALLILAHLLG